MGPPESLARTHHLLDGVDMPYYHGGLRCSNLGLDVGRVAQISQMVAVHQNHRMLPLQYALSHAVRNQSVKAPQLSLI